MAYVGSVVSVISYPPKSLLMWTKSGQKLMQNMYYTAKSCTAKWVNPHAFVLQAPAHWLNVIFVRSVVVLKYAWSVLFTFWGLSNIENTLEKYKYYLNELTLRKTVAEVIFFFFFFMSLKYIVSRIASSSTLKAAFVLREKSLPEENCVLASASSDADGAPNSLVKEKL